MIDTAIQAQSKNVTAEEAVKNQIKQLGQYCEIHPVFKNIPESAKEKMLEWQKLTPKEREQRCANDYNETIGKLTGYDCEICKNKGDVAFVDDDSKFQIKSCSCKIVRRLNKDMLKCGVANPEEFNFKRYITTEEWQKRIKTTAMKFVIDKNSRWFFIGGQVGAGKTHICTAILLEFMKKGKTCKYMSWISDVGELNSNVNDPAYKQLLEKYTEADVLYIDDLFKGRGGEYPTNAEVKRLFEVINHRYNNRSLITIISSEKTMGQLMEIDQASISRIKQRSEGFNLSLAEDEDRNFRIKKNPYGDNSDFQPLDGYSFNNYKDTNKTDYDALEKKLAEQISGYSEVKP